MVPQCSGSKSLSDKNEIFFILNIKYFYPLYYQVPNLTNAFIEIEHIMKSETLILGPFINKSELYDILYSSTDSLRLHGNT